jgi:hypothetical protein
MQHIQTHTHAHTHRHTPINLLGALSSFFVQFTETLARRFSSETLASGRHKAHVVCRFPHVVFLPILVAFFSLLCASMCKGATQ